MPAGDLTAEARSSSSLPDHSAHRLARPYVPVPAAHFAWIMRGILHTVRLVALSFRVVNTGASEAKKTITPPMAAANLQ